MFFLVFGYSLPFNGFLLDYGIENLPGSKLRAVGEGDAVRESFDCG